MSKSSIYETTWLDLVFDGKNKEYGAYQLRQENTKTTLKALFSGIVLVTALATATLLISSAKGETIPDIDPTLPTVKIVEVIQPVTPKKPELPKTNTAPPLSVEKPKSSMANPTVVKPELEKPDVPTNKEFNNSNASPIGVEGGIGTTEPTTNGGGDSPEAVEPVGGTSIYNTATVDKMPTYPGGMDGFYKFVGRNFRTPEDVLTSGSTVKVLVSFVIEKDGTMTEIKVNRNPGYGLDKEAIRVLKSIKVKWEPGSIKGQPVRVVYSLPIAVKVP